MDRTPRPNHPKSFFILPMHLRLEVSQIPHTSWPDSSSNSSSSPPQALSFIFLFTHDPLLSP